MDKGIHMKSDHRIAVKLAEAVAHDDEELAPFMIDSFLKGTKERRELFSRDKGSALGSIGVSDITSNLPLIFAAISASAAVINTIFLPKIYPKIKQYIDPSSSEKPRTTDNDFNNLINSFSKELATAGIQNDKCELVATKIIKILIADPEGQQFVKSLGAVVNDL